MDTLIFCFLMNFLIQFVGFVFAYTLQTEKFFDFFGSITYLLLIQLSIKRNSTINNRQLSLSIISSIWAVRLGIFLLSRVLIFGGDKRFEKVKTKPFAFFMYWMVQGLWVFITLLPTLLVNRTKRNDKLNLLDYTGFIVWFVGFVFEVVADHQKLMFKLNPETSNTFISDGLWGISRHPNYFGEILLWCGVFIASSSGLAGWEHISVISPLFVHYLLTKLSGVPILERLGQKKFGHLATYKHYIETVPCLVPWFGKP